MSKKTLLNAKDIEIILHRLACQLIENHNNFSNTVLIGLQPRGSFLAKRLLSLLKNEYQIKEIQLGSLDITFYRDDFRRRVIPLEANTTEIDFLVEDKKVIFIENRYFFTCLNLVISFGNDINEIIIVKPDGKWCILRVTFKVLPRDICNEVSK